MRWLVFGALMACGGRAVPGSEGPGAMPATVSGGGGGGAATPTTGGCSSDADCAAGQHCVGGELGTCTGGSVGTGGGSTEPIVQPGDGGVESPVDLSCENNPSEMTVYPPKWPTLPPTVPAGCRTGFELNEPYEYLQPNRRYEISSKTAAGSQALTLELDFATYAAPDGLKITGTLAGGATYVLFDTCRMQTADYGDPTDQQSRPPEDSIRDYRIALKAGTVKLAFDYTRSQTPTYTKVTGLCDFTLTQPMSPVSTTVHWFRGF